MFDLTTVEGREALALKIARDVNDACQTLLEEDHRKHLGASILANRCRAHGWNTFRNLKLEHHTGQQRRLFNRGHEEEVRFIRWLNAAGFQVVEKDPETDKQFRVGFAEGHGGGSLDTKLIPPESYGLSRVIWLGEFKTHNEKSFTKLAGKALHWLALKAGEFRTGGKGVFLSKPEHYDQMCIYGYHEKIEYGLYTAVNKNTDELYFEVVKLDWNRGRELTMKAEQLVSSRKQPPKVSMSPSFSDCTMCHFAGLCHGGEEPERHCKSCLHCEAIPGGLWSCDLYSPTNGPIPAEVLASGCPSWSNILKQ